MPATKKYRRALHIFRRDLRTQDNTALNEARKAAEEVIPCFIFDPRQLKGHPYFSAHCFQFLHESLHDLDGQLRRHGGILTFFKGEAQVIVEDLLKNLGVDAVYFNRDYTPFSLARDKAIKEVCATRQVGLHMFGDCLLQEPEESLKDDKTPYTVFTPYYKRQAQKAVMKPAALAKGQFFQGSLTSEYQCRQSDIPCQYNEANRIAGGSTEALNILESLVRFKDYQETRDFPALEKTTFLSAHNKFGTVSIREVYEIFCRRLGKTHPLVRQLYWRDFFSQIAFHFPHVFGGAFRKQYDKIDWENNEDYFAKWCEGKTGFPIVDAGMRELNTTGFMHNRVRMITSSFLVKDLHIDWRWGERYFAQQLLDYDPCVNNGSWQWAASTGCDAQPYFRIFNPWLQQKKFDPECVYIKKWVPELASVPAKTIHSLGEKPSPLFYIPPIVEHAERKSIAEQMFEDCR